jgi:hypothetical protein
MRGLGIFIASSHIHFYFVVAMAFAVALVVAAITMRAAEKPADHDASMNSTFLPTKSKEGPQRLCGPCWFDPCESVKIRGKSSSAVRPRHRPRARRAVRHHHQDVRRGHAHVLRRHPDARRGHDRRRDLHPADDPRHQHSHAERLRG